MTADLPNEGTIITGVLDESLLIETLSGVISNSYYNMLHYVPEGGFKTLTLDLGNEAYEIHGINLYYKKDFLLGTENTEIKVGFHGFDQASHCATAVLYKRDIIIPKSTINCDRPVIGKYLFIKIGPLRAVKDFRLFHITLNTPNAGPYVGK